MIIQSFAVNIITSGSAQGKIGAKKSKNVSNPNGNKRKNANENITKASGPTAARKATANSATAVILFSLFAHKSAPRAA